MGRRLAALGSIGLLLVLGGCAENDQIIRRQAELENRMEQLATGNQLISARLSDLEASLRDLHNRNEAASRQLEELKARNAEPKVIPPVIQREALVAPPAPAKLEVIHPPAKEAQASDSAGDAYIKAFGIYSANNYPEAIQAFEEFLGRYPGSEYAPNAQYWIGECHYTQKAFDKALVAFRQVVEKYPQSGKVPDALLKVAFSHISLGQHQQAKQALDDVVAKYPKSPAATKARERLKDGRF